MTNKDQILSNALAYDGDLHLDLWYPESDGNTKAFVIGLMSVRATDCIRVSYDFPRNGWKIEQAGRFTWKCDDDKFDNDWQEVAFVPSWGRCWDCPDCDSVNGVAEEKCSNCGFKKPCSD
jgi:hypothetical protein